MLVPSVPIKLTVVMLSFLLRRLKEARVAALLWRKPPYSFVDVLLVDDDPTLATPCLRPQFTTETIDVKVAFLEVLVVLEFVPKES